MRILRFTALAALVAASLMISSRAQALPSQVFTGAGVAVANGPVGVSIQSVNGSGVRSIEFCQNKSACGLGEVWPVQKIDCSVFRVDPKTHATTWFGGTSVRISYRYEWVAFRLVDGGPTGPDWIGVSRSRQAARDNACGAAHVELSRVTVGAFQQAG
jgi:hypothetical protein